MDNDPHSPHFSSREPGATPPGPGRAPRPRLSARVLDDSRWKLAIAIIGALTAIIGALAVAPTITGFFHQSESSDSTGPSTGSAPSNSVALSVQPAIHSNGSPAPSAIDSAAIQSPALSTSDDAATALAVGNCLAADLKPLPCTAIHRFEVVAVDSTECDAAVAVSYLAGNPDLDVIRARFTLSNEHACLVANAGDTDRSATIKGILAVSDAAAGSPFRLCRDDRTAPTEVSCDVPHTSEFIGSLGVPAPDTDDCQAAATAYLSRTYNDVSGRLKVTAIPTSDPSSGSPSCVITTRGNAVLTQSIRNVRTSALPLRAG